MTAALQKTQPTSEPASLLAEQAVIGVLLGRPELIDTVSPLLVADDFYAEAHRIVYTAMLEMVAAGDPVDFIGVQDRLLQARALDRAGGPAYLGELAISAPSGTNIAHHVAMIRDHSARRKVMKAAADIGERAASSTDLGASTSMGIEELTMLMRDSGKLKEPKPIGKILPAVIDEIGARENGVITAIKTGFDDFDMKISGGLRRGDLIVIAGRPSMGKTSFGMQIGQNVAIDGEPTMVFTLEMSGHQLAERSLAQIGGIDFSRIITGNLAEDDYERMAFALGKLHTIPLLIDDSGGLTVQDIGARARAQKKMGGLSVVVVDYLQIMGYAGRAMSRAEQVGEISRQMKALAKELDVAFILLSQLNRDVEKRLDKRPVMSDLRESGAIEQDADLIVMMYRDEYYNSDSEFKGMAEAIVRKQRNGEVGTVGLRFEGEKVRFANLGHTWSATN